VAMFTDLRREMVMACVLERSPEQTMPHHCFIREFTELIPAVWPSGWESFLRAVQRALDWLEARGYVVRRGKGYLPTEEGRAWLAEGRISGATLKPC